MVAGFVGCVKRKLGIFCRRARNGELKEFRVGNPFHKVAIRRVLLLKRVSERWMKKARLETSPAVVGCLFPDEL